MQFIGIVRSCLISLFLIVSFNAFAVETENKPIIYLNIPQNDPIYQPGGLAYNIISTYFPTQLPQFSFRYVNMSYQVFWVKVNQNNDVCNVFGLPHDNDKQIITSNVPTFLLPKPAILMLKKVAKRFNYQQGMDANIILNEPALFGSYMQGRRQHKTLDQTIAKLEKNQANIFGENYALSKIQQLLIKQRFDYFIGLPSLFTNITDKSEADFSVFEFKSLRPSKLYLVCNNSKKNKAFIEAFNDNKNAWFALDELAIAWRYIFQGQTQHPSNNFSAFQKAFSTP
jgi:hypothetical protein